MLSASLCFLRGPGITAFVIRKSPTIDHPYKRPVKFLFMSAPVLLPKAAIENLLDAIHRGAFCFPLVETAWTNSTSVQQRQHFCSQKICCKQPVSLAACSSLASSEDECIASAGCSTIARRDEWPGEVLDIYFLAVRTGQTQLLFPSSAFRSGNVRWLHCCSERGEKAKTIFNVSTKCTCVKC